MLKGWEKTKLPTTWKNEFQHATMEVNMTIFLFITTLDIEKKCKLTNLALIQLKQH